MKVLITLTIIGLFSLDAFPQWTITTGPVGGSVLDIIPVNSYIFLNANAGGVYRSENNGDNWNAVNHGLPKSPHCWAIAATGNTIYASVDAHGIYKSADFGTTWTQAGATINSKTFYSLLADGNDVYAGESEGGFYHSSDGGATWLKKGNNIGQVRNFVVTGGNLLIAASGSSGVAVYKSTNKGETLVNLNAPVININRISGYDNAIYVTGQTTAISRDFGMTWSTSPLGSLAIFSHNEEVILPRENSIFISEDEGLNWEASLTLPYNGTIWAVNRIGTTIFVGGTMGILISENNGVSWQEKNEGLKSLIVTHLAATGDNLFAGTDVGIFSSTDQGVTWTKRNNNGIRGIHINPTNSVIATGKGIFKTLDNGITWDLKQDVQGDLNNYFYILAGDQKKIFACEYGYQYYSANEGEDWISRSNPAFQDMGILNATVKGDTIVVLALDKILISKDFGLTWQTSVVTPGIYLAANDAIFIKNELYLASYQGIFKSGDLGSKWKKLNEMSNRSPLSLFHKGNGLYAGTTAGVHVSYDSGVTWYAVNEGMDLWTGPLALTDTHAFSGTYGMSVWANSLDKLNVRPTITRLEQPLELSSNLDIHIDLNDLLVVDPDDDFPQDFNLTVEPGANYTVTGNVVKPTDGYNGELHIPLVVNDGHFNSKDYVATVYVITGLQESLASFELFPNPATQKINFTMMERVKSVSLRDLAGREVARFEDLEGIDGTSSIDVSHLQKGIYFIELNGKGKRVQRFLKY